MRYLFDKRHLHHAWTVIRPLKTWYLFAAFLLFIVVGVGALRHNFTTMVDLRNVTYEVDKNNGNVEQALQDLRAHVGGHMNTNLDDDNGVYPPIQLKHTYERLVQAERDRVNVVNSKIYTDAQKHCEAQFPGSFSGGPRVPCIEQYVKSNGTTARNIPDAQYKFDFVSPRWSPDIAGWSLIFALTCLALGVIRFGLGRWLRAAGK